MPIVLGSKFSGAVMLIDIPKIDEMLAWLQSSKYFTSLDLRSGYYNIKLSPETNHRSAFTAILSKCKFLRMPFGLMQGPAYFTPQMHVFSTFNKFSFFHMVNVLVQNSNEEGHLEHLKMIFMKIKQAGLKLKSSKCAVFKRHLQYLENYILDEGLYPLEKKIVSLVNLAPHTGVTKTRHIICLASYYRNLLQILEEWSDLLQTSQRKTHLSTWALCVKQALTQLKLTLTNIPILIFPNPNETYVIFTDASKHSWSRLPAQERITNINDKDVKSFLPILMSVGHL